MTPYLRARFSPRLLGAVTVVALVGSLALAFVLVKPRGHRGESGRALDGPSPHGSPAGSPRAASRDGVSTTATTAAAVINAENPLAIAHLLRTTTVQLRVFPTADQRRRCALVVPYASTGVTVELSAGWRLAKLGGRGGVVPLGSLAAGLHWIEVAGAGSSHPGVVRGLAPGPQPGADPQLAGMQALYLEVRRLAHSRNFWHQEANLPEPHGPAGSPRALAQAQLLLWQTSEVPDAFNVLGGDAGKARMSFEFEAIQVRQRTDAVLAQVERALAERADRWDAWHALGWVLANADQRAMARLALARAVELWPASPWSFTELVRLEERELRELGEAGMPRTLLREVHARALVALRHAETHARAIDAPALRPYRRDLDTLGRRMRKAGAH